MKCKHKWIETMIGGFLGHAFYHPGGIRKCEKCGRPEYTQKEMLKKFKKAQDEKR